MMTAAIEEAAGAADITCRRECGQSEGVITAWRTTNFLMVLANSDRMTSPIFFPNVRSA